MIRSSLMKSTVGRVNKTLEFNRFHRTIAFLQTVESHDGNAMIVNKCSSDDKTVKYLVAVELKWKSATITTISATIFEENSE